MFHLVPEIKEANDKINMSDESKLVQNSLLKCVFFCLFLQIQYNKAMVSTNAIHDSVIQSVVSLYLTVTIDRLKVFQGK